MLKKCCVNCIPLAGSDDTFAQFASNPHNSVLPGEDTYKTVIDRALSNSIGYNKDAVEVVQIICQGALGIEGCCEWVRIWSPSGSMAQCNFFSKSV